MSNEISLREFRGILFHHLNDIVSP